MRDTGEHYVPEGVIECLGLILVEVFLKFLEFFWLWSCVHLLYRSSLLVRVRHLEEKIQLKEITKQKKR